MSSASATVVFEYNAQGLRLHKTVNGVLTRYFLSGKNISHMTQGSNSFHFWYDAQNRPAIVKFNGTNYAYVYNLQGDVVGLVDSTGNEVVKYTYDAWGKPISTTGSLASTLGAVQPFRYRGYVYDVETGLYYLRARYYNPNWNRFVNADMFWGDVGQLLAHSVFNYCLQSPISKKDEDGYETVAIGVAVGSGPPGWFVLGIITIIGICYFASQTSENTQYSNQDEIASPLPGPVPQSRSTPVPMTTPGPLAENVLPGIAGRYGNLQCTEARDSMLEFLKQNQLHGYVVTIQYPIKPGYVYSISQNRCISENGFHVGVEYKGIVYCNVHPRGLPFQTWLDDFDGVGERVVTRTPF